MCACARTTNCCRAGWDSHWRRVWARTWCGGCCRARAGCRGVCRTGGAMWRGTATSIGSLSCRSRSGRGWRRTKMHNFGLRRRRLIRRRGPGCSSVSPMSTRDARGVGSGRLQPEDPHEGSAPLWAGFVGMAADRSAGGAEPQRDGETVGRAGQKHRLGDALCRGVASEGAGVGAAAPRPRRVPSGAVRGGVCRVDTNRSAGRSAPDRHVWVRRNVAWNQSTPRAALETLLGDRLAVVRAAAVANKNSLWNWWPDGLGTGLSGCAARWFGAAESMPRR